MENTPNALGDKEIAFHKTHTIEAPPEAVYDVLADVRSHIAWGGEMSKKKFRLLKIDVADLPAVQGTVFSSEGLAPDGSFHDRSVVTQAVRPRIFEFRTDAHIDFKKGGTGDWTVINRYEIEPVGTRSRLRYTQRVIKATDLGPLKMMLNPLMAVLGRMMVGGFVKPGLRGIESLARERAGTTG